MEIYNYNRMGSIDMISLELVFKAYNETHCKEDIQMIGYNDTTGYVYIALENGIQIVSNFGQEVYYLVTDSYNGDEFFCDTYEEAETKLEKLNETV
ncbi:MAG: hypothetical protein Tp172MES766071_37 [Prokaryotic dsDNA virus sp.]|nr:MAG: hypothetical protein Tp172MES766071_37 [Prokaryotic dsDNA virus sp.]|tara:strand:+ start:23804 stop:24091 length:288 start_codon:yes stop_codon:yes gene_type:complete